MLYDPSRWVVTGHDMSIIRKAALQNAAFFREIQWAGTQSCKRGSMTR